MSAYALSRPVATAHRPRLYLTSIEQGLRCLVLIGHANRRLSQGTPLRLRQAP